MNNMLRYNAAIALFLTLSACGQKTGSNSLNDISSTKSEKHKNVAGTRLFIIPPEGFDKATGFAGFQHNQSILHIMDLPGGNFYTNAASVSRQNFEQRGIKVFDYRELKVNNYPAKMLFMQGDAQTKMYNLVFGDSTFSTMIIASFPANDSETEKKIKQSLETVYYDNTFTVDPFMSSVFKLDDSNSIFKFADYAASLYIYSVGGIKKKQYIDEPYIIISTLDAQGATLKDIADQMGTMLKNPRSTNVSEDKVNGLPCFRRQLNGTLNDKPTLLYQHAVYIGENAVIFQGITNVDLEKNLLEFAKLANTLTKK